MAGSTKKAVRFFEVVDKELTCGICLDVFKTPIILPCGHNFCRNCVIEHADSLISFNFLALGPPKAINCPLCQQEMCLDKYPIQSLPVNKALESIIELYSSHSHVDVFDSSWNSDMCMFYGPEDCILHKLKVDRYCESCCKAVCQRCEQDEHQSLKAKHRVKSLKETALNLQTRIANILSEIKGKSGLISERMVLLEDMQTEIDKQREQILKDLDTTFSTLMTSIRQQQNRLKEEFEAVVMEIKQPISNVLQACLMQKSNIQENMKKLATIRRTKDTNHRIKSMKDASKQLESLCVSLTWFYDNQDIPAVTMATWRPSIQPAMDAIRQMAWDKSKSSSFNTTSIGLQTDTDFDDDNYVKVIKRSNGHGQVEKQGQNHGNHVGMKNSKEQTDIHNKDKRLDSSKSPLHKNTSLKSSRPKQSPGSETTELKPESSTLENKICEISVGKSENDGNNTVCLSSIGNTPVNICQTHLNAAEPGTNVRLIQESGDQKSPRQNQMSLTKSLSSSAATALCKTTSQRLSLPDSLPPKGFEYTSTANGSKDLNSEHCKGDASITSKFVSDIAMNSRSPSSSSLALATFVARRRTVSPHPVSPNTSKAPSPSGHATSPSRKILLSPIAAEEMIEGAKSDVGIDDHDELAPEANISQRKTGNSLISADGARKSPVAVLFDKEHMGNPETQTVSRFLRAPIKVSLDFNLGNNTDSSELKEKRSTDV